MAPRSAVALIAGTGSRRAGADHTRLTMLHVKHPTLACNSRALLHDRPFVADRGEIMTRRAAPMGVHHRTRSESTRQVRPRRHHRIASPVVHCRAVPCLFGSDWGLRDACDVPRETTADLSEFADQRGGHHIDRRSSRHSSRGAADPMMSEDRALSALSVDIGRDPSGGDGNRVSRPPSVVRPPIGVARRGQARIRGRRRRGAPGWSPARRPRRARAPRRRASDASGPPSVRRPAPRRRAHPSAAAARRRCARAAPSGG